MSTRTTRWDAKTLVTTRLRAFTLVELVASTAVAAILMTGLASALLLATRALPNEDCPAGQVLGGARILDEIVADLQAAQAVVEHTAWSLTFLVADRDRDGVSERIRYAWSGTAADPLTRQCNAGPEVAVEEGVYKLSFGYDIKSIAEEYVGAPVESGEVELDSHGYVYGEAKSFKVEKDKWPGQYFEPSLPNDAVSWRVTRLFLYVIADGPREDTTLVQLRLPKADRTPTDTVLYEEVMDEANLNTYYAWEEIVYGKTVNVNPDTGLCIVLKHGGGGPSARIMYDEDGGSGGINTKDAGKSWGYFDWLARLYYVYGKYSTPGPPQTATRQYLTGVHIDLQLSSDAESRVQTSGQLLNAPELLSTFWEADFSTDPTILDVNGDGVGDWDCRGGGSFDSGRLGAGVWNADATLDTCPNNNFTELTTVDVSFWDKKVGGNGAVFWVNADWGDGRVAPIFAFLQLQEDSKQTLTVFHKWDDGTPLPLVSVGGLPNNFVQLRLLIDPDLDTVNVRVNGDEIGTYIYHRVVSTDDNRWATVQAWDSDAYFDYVRVRVGGNN